MVPDMLAHLLTTTHNPQPTTHNTQHAKGTQIMAHTDSKRTAQAKARATSYRTARAHKHGALTVTRAGRARTTGGAR